MTDTFQDLDDWEAGRLLLTAIRNARAALTTCHTQISEKELMLAIIILLKKIEEDLELLNKRL